MSMMEDEDTIYFFERCVNEGKLSYKNSSQCRSNHRVQKDPAILLHIIVYEPQCTTHTLYVGLGCSFWINRFILWLSELIDCQPHRGRVRAQKNYKQTHLARLGFFWLFLNKNHTNFRLVFVFFFKFSGSRRRLCLYAF